MNAYRIILASLPSFCKKNYQTCWKFDKVLTKTNLHSFLKHGVVRQGLGMVYPLSQVSYHICL